jgi:uncharacterized coiled-coil protein SlyX
MNSKFKKFLELTKLTAETVTAVLPFIKMLLVATGALVLAFVVSSDRFGKKEEQYLADMRKFKEQATLASQYADSLESEVVKFASAARTAQTKAQKSQQQAQQSLTQAVALSRELDSIRDTVTDSTEMARVIIPKQEFIIEQQILVIAYQDTTIQNLNSTIVNQDSMIGLISAARDSLQTVMDNIPEPPPPPPFPQITRKRAFIGGVIVGLAAKVLFF